MGYSGSKLVNEGKVEDQKKILSLAIKNIEREKNKISVQKRRMEVKARNLWANDSIDSNTLQLMAKDIIHLEGQFNKLSNLKTQMTSVKLRFTKIDTTKTMTQSLENATKALMKLNNRSKLSDYSDIMKKYSRQLHKFELRQDMEDPIQSDVEDEIDDKVVCLLKKLKSEPPTDNEVSKKNIPETISESKGVLEMRDIEKEIDDRLARLISGH